MLSIQRFLGFVNFAMALRWKILALLVIARIGLGFQFQTVASVSDQLIGQFNVDYTTVGTLIGIFMLTGLFLALPAGWTGRFTSDGNLASIGMALLAIGGFIAAFADSTSNIGLGRMVCGSGFVLCTIYFAKMTTDWFAGQEIATAMGLLVMTWPLGIAAGQIIHSWLAQNFHWSTAFIAASSYCTIGAVAVFLLYRPPVTNSVVSPDGIVANAHQPQSLATKKKVFTRTELMLTAVASISWALFNAGYVVFLSFAPGWLGENGYSTLEAAVVVSSGSWVMIISIVAGGALADQVGKPDTVFYMCMLVAVVSLLSLYWTDYSLLACLLFGLIGAAPAGIIMALASEAIEPHNRALGMGVFFSLYFLLVAPAPVVAGWLVDYSGSSWFAIVFAVCLFAATALGYAAFRITQRSVNQRAT